MAAFPPRERDAFMAHWAKTFANDSALTLTVVSDGAVAGNIGCWEDDGGRLVGDWIGREFWGRGLATQALAELLDVVDARPLHAYVAKSNVASIRVLEKCGFVKVGEHAGDDEIEEILLELRACGPPARRRGNGPRARARHQPHRKRPPLRFAQD